MSEKGSNSPFFRKMITVVMFAGIAAALIGLYYLVYLPQQHEEFNQRTFRVLKEITDNFSMRVSNYGKYYSNAYISRKEPLKSVTPQEVIGRNLPDRFKRSFTGDARSIVSFNSKQRIENDSIIYEIIKRDTLVDSPRQSLSDVLEPLISIHANTFESVLLIKQQGDTLKGEKSLKKSNSILYRSAGSNIVSFSTDTLWSRNKLIASSVNDLDIEGINYKMFVYPFQVKAIGSGTFLLAGLITEKSYQKQSRAVPLKFLFAVGFLIVLLLLILPFLKIFILSIQENITIADVRLIVAVIFIIPLVITLFISVAWLYKYPDAFSTDVLMSMQNSIKKNFYNEIERGVRQVKDYDSLMNNPAGNFHLPDSSSKTTKDSLRLVSSLYSNNVFFYPFDFRNHPWVDTDRNAITAWSFLDNRATYIKLNDSSAETPRDTILLADSMDAKDILFYPRYYKNIENVHWMDAEGDDIAVWSFLEQRASYFRLKDRPYFIDIRDHKGYALPGSKDTFSIQPVLSRLTGEYTINLAIASNTVSINKKKPMVVGISTKMYSLYNTVVPPGYAYCLIDEKGGILSHSDTARNLQENLFEETTDNHSLHIAINHKDSALIDDIDLNDQPVKMMVKPLPGLPYYLVTYYEKRSEYLFVAHILAFVFLCQSIILLFVSLFSYCMMMAHKKIYKLFFIPGGLNWVKPSRHKKEYYIKNSFQLILCLLIVFLFAIFLPSEYYYLYMLHASFLLPLFAVTGYYIIKAARKNNWDGSHENEELKTVFPTRQQFAKFFLSVINILVLYILCVFIFLILQSVFSHDTLCDTNFQVTISVWILIIVMPFIICVVAVANFRVVWDRQLKLLVKLKLLAPLKDVPHPSGNNYLRHFIMSLLCSVLVISVIPTITFTGYALHEERKLHFQSFQLELAKKIQQRRTEINARSLQTKVLNLPKAGHRYIDSLKFRNDRGLYLFSNQLSKSSSVADTSAYNNCSPFYKLVTQFLFLPPDHDEFFDNPSHQQYYSWKETFDRDTFDSLTLSYKNLTDYKDPSSIVLKAGIPHFYVFKDITNDSRGCLILLALVVFIILFYKIIYSISKRIFLVGFFDNGPLKDKSEKLEDKPWLKLKYAYVKIEDLCKPVFPIQTPLTFAELRDKENSILENCNDGGETILKLHIALTPVYEKIWKDCTDTEKYTLYDFALDGFTNYKKVIVLYQLLEKGLLIKEAENITLMTASFRNFLITKGSSQEIKNLGKEVKGSWAAMRSVFYIILIAVAVFIFISQEEASKRLITIVTSLAALLPVILKLFDKSTFSASSNKTGS